MPSQSLISAHLSRTALALFLTAALACQGGEPSSGADDARASTGAATSSSTRNAYFGDLHLHTALSVDAYITNTRTLPDDAYRYAKGEPIDHLSGEKIQLRTPLDFLAVTDHAEFLGGVMAETHDFLASLDDVDASRISGLGVCASSGYMAAAVADDA